MGKIKPQFRFNPATQAIDFFATHDTTLGAEHSLAYETMVQGAKGDLLTFGPTVERLAVGTDDFVLAADSSTITGLSWKAAAGAAFINAATYGALPGAGDVTTEIQAALDAASSGDIVFFAPGTYTCTAALDLDSGGSVLAYGAVFDFGSTNLSGSGYALRWGSVSSTIAYGSIKGLTIQRTVAYSGTPYTSAASSAFLYAGLELVNLNSCTLMDVKSVGFEEGFHYVGNQANAKGIAYCSFLNLTTAECRYGHRIWNGNAVAASGGWANELTWIGGRNIINTDTGTNKHVTDPANFKAFFVYYPTDAPGYGLSGSIPNNHRVFGMSFENAWGRKVHVQGEDCYFYACRYEDPNGGTDLEVEKVASAGTGRNVTFHGGMGLSDAVLTKTNTTGSGTQTGIHKEWNDIVYTDRAYYNEGLTVNQSAADADFVVKSTGSGAMIWVDAANDFVGIKDSSPSYVLDVNGTGRYTGVLQCDSALQGISGQTFDIKGSYNTGEAAPTSRIEPTFRFYNTSTAAQPGIELANATGGERLQINAIRHHSTQSTSYLGEIRWFDAVPTSQNSLAMRSSSPYDLCVAEGMTINELRVSDGDFAVRDTGAGNLIFADVSAGSVAVTGNLTASGKASVGTATVDGSYQMLVTNASSAQLKLAHDATKYAELHVDSSGRLWLHDSASYSQMYIGSSSSTHALTYYFVSGDRHEFRAPSGTQSIRFDVQSNFQIYSGGGSSQLAYFNSSEISMGVPTSYATASASDTIQQTLKVVRGRTGGGAGAGFGGAIAWNFHNSTPAYATASTWEVDWTDATAGSEDAEINFYLAGNGTPVNPLRLSGANNSVIVVNEFAHTGSTAGFYNTTPAARPSAYTQTYSTASRTVNNPTSLATFRPMGEMYLYDNSTATTITTGSTWTQVQITFTDGHLSSFDTPTAYELRYTGATTTAFHLGCTISFKVTGAANQTVKAVLVQNATVDANQEYTGGTILNGGTIRTKTGTASDEVSTAIHIMASLAQNDTLSLFVQNATSTSDITIIDCNLFGMGITQDLADDIANVKQNANQVIDDLQTIGLLQ